MRQEVTMKDSKKSDKDKEFMNFSSLADEWWDENGKFSILHKINPLRIKYIVNQISKYNKVKKIIKLPLKNLKIVDIGCGGGLVCEPLKRLGGQILGVDFVEKNIKIAKKHALKENLKIKYIVDNINNLKLNKKYDVILLLEIIEHIEDWHKTIKKIKRILNPNGIIILSTINRNFLSLFFAIFMAERFLKWIPQGTHDYQKLVKPKELSKTLKKNNFRILDFTGMNYNPLKREWKLSKNVTKINYFCTAQKIN